MFHSWSEMHLFEAHRLRKTLNIAESYLKTHFIPEKFRQFFEKKTG